jgi:hypothetical protein
VIDAINRTSLRQDGKYHLRTSYLSTDRRKSEDLAKKEDILGEYTHLSKESEQSELISLL